MSSPHEPRGDSPTNDSASVELIERAKSGDSEALDRLMELYVPPLTRWASGRLPHWARHSMDTDDLVQTTILKSLTALKRFEPRHEGALQAYLRRAIRNRVVDELREAGRRPGREEVNSGLRSEQASPLEEAIGREAVERYEAALARLPEAQQQAVVARLELGLDYARIARELGRPSRDAARMAVSRALLRLAREMES